MTRCILGTRGSRLALAQSTLIAETLRARHPDLEVELRIITTKGDQILDVALSAVGDKGLFVKELEQALLAGEVDCCVHSCKDMPSALPEGLMLAAFPERADPRDVLVVREGWLGEDADLRVETLPQGAVVGTSSLRRACQLRALRPDLQLVDVRGNVDTRLRKLAEGRYDALILAAAGLQRLDLLKGDRRLISDGAPFVAAPVPVETMLPAATQGILAIECRADDTPMRELLTSLDHGPSRAAALAERAFLRRLEGGCQVPMAAYATLDGPSDGAGATLRLRGLVGSLDGTLVVRGERSGPVAEAEALGADLAAELLERGAAEILTALVRRKG